ncbi:MAG TPA: sugar transferase [Streptosporangiaceae bacterium]|nr:sugar transferase [Streptosporangiaceae bacterium]
MLTDHEAERLRGATASTVLKRGLDVILAAILLACTLPVMLIACVAIMLDSPGPSFYLQWRSGRAGRPFRIVKLRTMVAGADRVGPKLTQEADPRVTRVGRVLRRWSLDEMPQLVNVLAGQMSLVGPRPELISIVETYPPRHLQVLQVRPGVTGWAQVNGRDDLPIREKLELDLEYVTNRTTLQDLFILARTVAVVLNGSGVKR